MALSDKLRVLHLGKYYPPHRGGIETHVQALCRRLHQQVALEVVVSSMTRDSEEFFDGFKVTRAGKVMTISNAPVSPAMIGKIRQFKPDIVHIHHPNPFAMIAYFASGTRARLVLSYHSDIVRQKALAALFAPLLTLTLRRASAIVVATQAYVDSSPVLQKYRDRCHIIPYAIYPEDYAVLDRPAIDRIHQTYGDDLITAVGRLVYYKGFEYLVDAMASVNGRLVIIGNGPLREHLEGRVRTLKLEDRVFFLGDIPEVAPYYQAARVVVLPSIARSESFGIVQLEAMACGKPVINTRLQSGVPHVSLDGVTGLTVPPANSAALSEALNTLLRDRGLCERYGAAGRQRVRTEFRVDAMAEQTMQVYHAVTDSVPVARTSPNPVAASLAN